MMSAAQLFGLIRSKGNGAKKDRLRLVEMRRLFRCEEVKAMRRQHIPSLTHFYRTSFSVTAIVFLLAILCVAQAGAPKYDTSTETKLKGTVEEIKMPPNAKEIAHLLVKDGTGTFDLYLCPKSFMDDMGVTFAKGDEVAFTGSKVKQGDGEMILAREVVKGTDTLILRDDKGNPVWSWKH
jgi:hypothetical protein